jgi:hypothetical protein
MAKKLKDAAGSENTVAGLPKKDVKWHINNVISAGQKKDDATSHNASAWKRLKDCGGHSEAIKLGLKLQKMSDDKRADFLRSFDEIRLHLDLDAQGDLFDEDQVTADDVDTLNAAQAAADAQPWQGEGEPIGESGEIVHPEPEPVAAEAEDGAKGEAPELADAVATAEDAWDEANISAEDMPEDAGAVFNAGRDQRDAGGTLKDNPHKKSDKVRRTIWADGWKQRDQELSEAAEPAPVEDAEGMGYAERAEVQGEDQAEATAEAEDDGLEFGDEADTNVHRLERPGTAVPPSKRAAGGMSGGAYTV